MCADSEGSGETARIRRLARSFAGRLCDKNHNLMSWLILPLDMNRGDRALGNWDGAWCENWLQERR